MFYIWYFNEDMTRVERSLEKGRLNVTDPTIRAVLASPDVIIT